jgi:hypothetical protein
MTCILRGRRPLSDAKRERFEAAILDTLAARRPGVTVCPSEVARAMAPETATRDGSGDANDNGTTPTRPEAWRAHMHPVREAAARLAARGAIDVLQKGVVVDVTRARGPVRLRLVARAPDAGADEDSRPRQ